MRDAVRPAGRSPGLPADPPGPVRVPKIPPMIYLLRHGDAEPDQGAGDAARRLTGKGRAQAEAAGKAMARLGLVPDCCLTSPKVRAMETARLACAELGIEIETEERIAGGHYDTLELVAGRGDAMLVGHEPDMSAEIARLTGARVKLKKGGLAVLEPRLLRILMRPAELSAVAAA